MNTPMDILVSVLWATFTSLLTCAVIFWVGLTIHFLVGQHLLLLFVLFLCNFLAMAFLLFIGKRMRS